MTDNLAASGNNPADSLRPANGQVAATLQDAEKELNTSTDELLSLENSEINETEFNGTYPVNNNSASHHTSHREAALAAEVQVMPYIARNYPKPSDPRSLEVYALAYKEQLQALGYATQSVQYKHASLIWFIEWCHERGIERIEAITRPVLQRYQRHLYFAVSRSGKPLSVASQRNRLTAVRTWFKFLMRENLILYNPASELELPKPEKRLPKHTLSAEEAELILTQPDLDTDQGVRDRAILEVLYSTGIRR